MEVGEDARALVDRTDVPGTEVELGGDIFVEPVEFSSEAIGFVAAMVILIIAFGSVLAMGLPLLTALFGVATGIALVGLTGAHPHDDGARGVAYNDLLNFGITSTYGVYELPDGST